jgi:hypothetical protein
MPTAAKSKRRVARGCAIGGAELRLKGLKKSDRRHGGASLVRCRKFRPVAGGLYRSLTGYVVKIKTDAGKVRFIGPRGVARLQSRAKRFDTQSEAKQAAESTIARGYGKIRSAAVVKAIAASKRTSGIIDRVVRGLARRERSRKSVKNGRGTGHRYEVIVGNIGTVYDGASMSAASETYRDYVMMSKSERGRAGGESVTMFKDGDIVREHAGSSEDY